ncbi:hypothetical protein HUN08_14000 [Gordonia sp. X0973]|uniref:hypothetical protein n=1 Tax=Gordonia sp. X0973 TaxID=2742602 RepID=UPI000F54AD7C|nr:hypothetical protein [Gordonia sp. X0973]QKT08182.1 hypothetical protein HUN08_14000 [Gordonia sp. X0973]
MSFGGADLQMLGPNTNPLPYGQTLTVGDFRCSVETDTGVTCDNTLSHHGFTISDHTFDLR